MKSTEKDLVAEKGIADAKRRVKEEIANVKAFAAADIEQTKADFKQAKGRFAAWDAAATRDFEARLDAADAQLAAWKAADDLVLAEDKIQMHDDFATLKESIALARARTAAAKHEKYTVKALEALEDAAVAFDQAYDAAATRYN